MTFRALPALFVTLLGAAPALAVDLFTVEGRWVGTGSLATKVTRPMQPARCEVEVEQKEAETDISMTGRCIVGAGGANIAFRMVRSAPGTVRGALKSGLDDVALQLAGTDQPGAVDLRSTAPWVVDDESYETLITVREPDVDSFAIRQMVRLDAAEPWRLIVDMTYRQP
jgi:hypothetical protein